MGPLLNDISVNGERVPAAVIAAEAQNHPAPPDKPGLAWRAAARALAIRTLLLHEAKQRGIVATPEAVAPGQTETEDEALIRALLDDCVKTAPVSDADVLAAHVADPARFRAPALYEAAHILLPITDAASAQRAELQATAILTALVSAPHRFAELARQHSACMSATNGGRLGQISAGDTAPQFDAALAGLAEGAITPAAVRTKFGLHIIRLDARAEGAVLPFEAVAPGLRLALEKAAWARAARAFIKNLVARAEITGIDVVAA